MPKTKIRVANSDGKSLSDWLSAPTYFTIEARPVNRFFAVHGHVCNDGSLSTSGYTVTHRLTGFAAATGLDSIAQAVTLAKRLTSAYSAKRWNFTDPLQAKGMKRAKLIARETYDR